MCCSYFVTFSTVRLTFPSTCTTFSCFYFRSGICSFCSLSDVQSPNRSNTFDKLSRDQVQCFLVELFFGGAQCSSSFLSTAQNIFFCPPSHKFSGVLNICTPSIPIQKLFRTKNLHTYPSRIL
jgi:hypothetical protein